MTRVKSRIILQSITKNKIKLYPDPEVARCTSCSRQARGGFSAGWTGTLGCSDVNAKKHSHRLWSERNAHRFRGRIALKIIFLKKKVTLVNSYIIKTNALIENVFSKEQKRTANNGGCYYHNYTDFKTNIFLYLAD